MTKKRSVKNESFVGYYELVEMKEEVKNLENIKHPVTITEYTQPSEFQNIEKDVALVTYGLDVETNQEGDMKYLGISYPDGRYWKGYDKSPQWFVEALANFVWQRTLDHKSTNPACMVAWRELDGIVIYKTLLQSLDLSYEEQLKLLYRYGHVEGRFNKGIWELDPVIKVNTVVKSKPTLKQNETTGDWEEATESIEVEFGILQAIGGSVCLFIRDMKRNSLRKIWLFDVSTLQKGNIEQVAHLYNIPYKKGDEQYHIVDWDLFKNDPIYRNRVILSNQEDARAVREIANHINEHFSQIFFKPHQDAEGKWVNSYKYPNGLWSTGTLCVFALSMSMARNDFKSLNWTEQMKDWLDGSKHDQETIKALYLHSVESYKAGLIEEYARGSAQKHEKVFVSDISSAFPFVMGNLFDLRYSVITKGTDEPTPPKANEYLIMRAKVEGVPMDAIHSVGIKEPKYEEMKIHPSGDFISTALWEEWELLKKQGGTVTVLEWVKISTTGQPHPLAKVINKLFKKRMGYIKKQKEFEAKAEKTKDLDKKEEYLQLAKDHEAKAETIKITMNSIYGKTFEATRKYIEIDKKVEDETHRVLALTGFKAGQLFNPLLATLITGLTRVRMIEKALEIQEQGGQVIMALTDSLHWIGNGKELAPKKANQSILARFGNDLQYNGWTEQKTLGTWEKPQQVFDYMAVGNGRYQYRDEKGKLTLKLRGMMLNVMNYQAEAKDIRTEDQQADQYQPLKDMVQEAINNDYRKKKGSRQGEPVIRFKQRILGNPAFALHHQDPSKLGQIHEVDEEAIVHVIFPKRIILEFDDKPTLQGLLQKMYITYAPSKNAYKETSFKDWDGTLKPLRDKLDELNLVIWETDEMKADKKNDARKVRDQIRRKQRKELGIFLGFGSDKNADQQVKNMISTLKDQDPQKSGLQQVEELAMGMGFSYSLELIEWAKDNGVTI